MKTVKDLRKQQYNYRREVFPYLFDFIRNPYSFIKTRFYIETSTVLVWFLLKTNINPNTVTVIYGLAGIATGILLAIPNKYTICIALLIAFTKGILDWSDGFLARITGKTSLTGHILDVYGAYLNSIGLQIGLGLYVANNSSTLLFYYLVPILLFFRMADLYEQSKLIILYNFTSIYQKGLSSIKDFNNEDDQLDNHPKIKIGFYNKLRKLFFGFLDDRARSVDFICGIIILELFYPINVSPYIFVLIIIKHFIIFFVSFFKVAKGGWAENFANKQLTELHTVAQKTKSQ